jgi:hypothetical protein
MDAQIINVTSGLPLYRENDSLIMDSPTIKELSRKEQILVNRCRIFLQIENTSDITNAEGKKILSQYISNHPTKPSRSRKQWPLQSDPGREAWNIWKRVISRAFLNANDELLKPLGAWTKQNLTRSYEEYWSQKEAALIQQHGKHSWRAYTRVKSERRQNYYSRRHRLLSQFPKDAIPVDIKKETEKYIITGGIAALTEKTHRTANKMLRDKVQAQRQDPLLDQVEITMDEQQIGELLKKRVQFDIASDGGHDQNTGILTYGWVLSMNKIIIAKSRGPAEVHPRLAESFRAEAYGLVVAITFIQIMVHHYDITVQDHRWFFILDSKTLIQHMESYSNDMVTSKWALKADADITQVAHKNMIGMNAQFIHIKGHQDMRSTEQPLNFTTKLNTQTGWLLNSDNS